METTTTKFLFRDHRDTDNDSVSGAGSDDVSSIHTEDDVDGQDDEFQSMTAMGIKHLCSELMELKEESDEEFYRTILSDYSAFIKIFEEVEVMEREMSQLKSRVSDQKKLVDDLMDGLRENLSMGEANEYRDDEYRDNDDDELIYVSELDAHAVTVSETLDILLVENRVDEAITILEKENENLRRMEEENECLPDTFRAIKSLISEMEATLELQLTVVAENPRISAPELQTTLAHLKRLGNGSLANQLLFKYYHHRIAVGIKRLEHSRLSFHNGVYTRDLSKLVFSLISQAMKGFGMLNAEDDSADTRELTQWAEAETEAFAGIFSTYVKSIFDINTGLSTAVQCMEFVLSYCSILESQGIYVTNRLVDGIRPCMEEILQVHIEHCKKVVRIFTASDGWTLGKYLVSGILAEGDSTLADGERLEYCYLTNSGRKLVMLLRAITEDGLPLLVLGMRNSIVEGLKDLYMEYVALLKEAVTCDRRQNDDPEFDSPETLTRQVSVLANVSKLEVLFCRMIASNFHGDWFDSCLFHVLEASDLLRSCFCQDFVSRVMSSQNGLLCYAEIRDDERNSSGLMPSTPFQVLFLELRKIERLPEEEVFEKGRLSELLRELIEAAFAWLQNTMTNSDADDSVPDLALQYQENPDQFAIDLLFLVEIAKHGGHFSEDPHVLESLSNSVHLSTDPDLQRDLVQGAAVAAEEAIRRLLEFEKDGGKNKNLLHTQVTSDSDRVESEDGEVDASDSRNVFITSVGEESSVISEGVTQELHVSEDFPRPEIGKFRSTQ